MHLQSAICRVPKLTVDYGGGANFSGIIKFNDYDLGINGFFRAATLLNIGKIIVIP